MTSAATCVSSDYTSVSESPGIRVTAEALQMLYTRYAYAASLAVGKDVLEVACGPGHGLGLLAHSARRVVGGDLTSEFVKSASRYYGDRLPVLRLDAQDLPFADLSFDLVLLFEAVYYLPDVRRFLREARRVLRPDGTILICTANRECAGFNASPFHTRYYSALELKDLLADEGFVPEMLGAFRCSSSSWRGWLVDHLRSVAIRLHLMPKTMGGKEWLKRLFYGRLHTLGPEVTERMSSCAQLFPIPPHSPSDFKVIYAQSRIMK